MRALLIAVPASTLLLHSDLGVQVVIEDYVARGTRERCIASW